MTASATFQRLIGTASVFLAAVLLAGSAAAQVQPQPMTPNSVTQAGSVSMPDNLKLTLLVQSYMAALSHANITGNYTVLWALGSPTFQNLNPPNKLADAFASFRSQTIDISPILLFPPILSASPRLDENNILHLAGYYNTSPERVTFDITIAPVNNVWRLGSISVKVLPPPSVAQAAPAPRPATAPITKKKSPGQDSKEAVTKAR